MHRDFSWSYEREIETGKPANLCQPLKYKKLKPKSSRKKRMTNRPAMSMKIAGLGIHDTAVSWS